MKLNELVKNYDKFYEKNTNARSAVQRNKIGLPLHLGIMALCMAHFAMDAANWANNIIFLGVAKMNFDSIPIINNINKRKASLLSSFLKNRNVTDPNELEWTVAKYLFEHGSYHYPFMHPKKTNLIAKTGEVTHSFETSLFFENTDVKKLIRKIFKSKNPQ